jgi:hypothetical protein
MIKKMGIINLFMVAFLFSCATIPVPLPSDFRVVTPPPTVPKELAAFSGKWSGVWDGILDHILVVEEIDPTHAVVIYAWGTSTQWRIDRPGWSRVRGEFVGSALKLSLPRPATVIYRMRADGTLDATYEWTGGISRAKMTRTKE